jgi:hypothetical protein
MFLIVVGLFGTYFWNFLPGETKEMLLQGTLEGLPEADENVSSSLSQFYPNMRFNHNDLTYSFISACSDDKISKMIEAFGVLEDRVGIISFQETTGEEADVLVSCSKERVSEAGNIFITGEGGPSKFLNLSLYPLILQGEILLYEELYKERRSQCEEPVVEIHELLHVFGYDHVDNKSSVLYPYFACDQELGDEFVDDLIRLYSIEPKAEIYYKNVSADKSGVYLNFNISLVNEGLIEAKAVSLIVEGDGKEQEEFELKDVDVGTITTFSIENFRLSSRNIDEIEFRLVTETEEYSLENNVAKLRLV